MESIKDIINKYKDEFGYVERIDSLCSDLLDKDISKTNLINLLKKIYEDNQKIINKISIENKKLGQVITHKENISDKEYIKEEKQIKKQNNSNNETIDISFYIEYINQNINNYLNILPLTNTKDSIKIIDTILTYYVKEINTIKYLLSTETDKAIIDLLIEELYKFNNIFNTILNYKESLFYIEKEDEITNKNELIFYMNGDTSYIYSDIIDYPESYESIKMLLESIENGTFKNIKSFSNDDKLKGILEVRDIKNTTRVFFEPLGNRKYCIIYAITNKRETNQLYKNRLYIRLKKYYEEKNNISINANDIKKLLLWGE